ncbi:aminotransferase class IV family protein [uncultured Sphingomonas sp.]|uniref:aminotransferase class IV family protein n=1 Tax=uncultured Sphingomonas sp. TaxID=158754 RepID=UPI0025F7B98F|nr:aminotransferase class IV family protein [uncultured Sphingomonas sp.]
MTDLTLVDGASATPANLAPLAFAGFAHFTAMQVRNGRVRGLDLHLGRLRRASLELFGRATPDEQVVAEISSIVDRAPNASLTITMFLRSGEFVRADDSPPAVLIRTMPATDGPVGPLRLDMVRHDRWRPDIKHVGEAAKTYFLHRAIARGFDDAAFVDSQGRLAEATIWNLAFWDGASIVWPKAAVLRGVTMAILQRQLAAAGVPQREASVRADAVAGLEGAVVVNSWTPGLAVSSIGDHQFDRSDALAEILHDAYAREPWKSPV